MVGSLIIEEVVVLSVEVADCNVGREFCIYLIAWRFPFMLACYIADARLFFLGWTIFVDMLCGGRTFKFLASLT